MDIICEPHDGAWIAHVQEARIDAAVAIQFKERMRKILSEGPNHVLLDLRRVEFLDSSGLGALVAVMKYAGPHQKLELFGLTSTVAKVFRLTRMDQVFTILPQAPAYAVVSSVAQGGKRMGQGNDWHR